MKRFQSANNNSKFLNSVLMVIQGVSNRGNIRGGAFDRLGPKGGFCNSKNNSMNLECVTRTF